MAGVGIVIEDKDQDDELTASGAKNNGQLRFVHHHQWRTQAAWTKIILIGEAFVKSNYFWALVSTGQRQTIFT